jgi:hypothetical protein
MGASRVVRFREPLVMKLVAVKHISNRLPKGSIFEASSRHGRVLIAIKAATPYVPPPPDPLEPIPDPQWMPEVPALEPGQMEQGIDQHSPIQIDAEFVEPMPEQAPPADDPTPKTRRGRASQTGHRSA